MRVRSLHNLSRRSFPAAIAAAVLFAAVAPASPRTVFAQAVAQPLASAGSYSQLSPEQEVAIDAAIAAQMHKDGVTGVAIGVLQKGQIVYLKGYGKADSKDTPVTARTSFRWASCSKPVTAIAALQLAEKGKLDLDSDVRKYVPEFPDKGAVITVRQLLCHESGIPHYTNGKVVATKATYTAAHPFADVVTALDTFKDSPLLFAPGEKYSYSTYGYVLLSAVVQRAGGETYWNQVRTRIAEPLGMASFQPDYPWVNIPNRAEGFQKTLTGVIRPSPNVDVSWKLGGGGYTSTIEDIARFSQGLLNHKLVNQATEAAMWTEQPVRSGAPSHYGLGFSVDGMPGSRAFRVSHSGAQEATRTRIVLYPNRNDGVVVMTNCEWGEPGNFSTSVYRALASVK